MKRFKLIGSLVGSLLVACLLFAGCKVTPDQIKAISNAVGLFSAVTWIAFDNPPVPVKTAVITVLNTVKEKAGSVEAGKTYTEVLYPEVVKVIDTQIAEQYRPLCKVGAATLLGQLDLLFAAHPDWKKDQDVALDVVIEFCKGAEQGLSMSETDLIIVQAKKNAARRLQLIGK